MQVLALEAEIGAHRLPLVTALLAGRLIAPGAERLVAGARQDDGADRAIGPGLLERVDQLIDGLHAKRVHHLRTVDRDGRHTFFGLVTNVFEAHGCSLLDLFQVMERPPLTESVWPVMNPASSDARNATAAAMSSGSPVRPSGIAFLSDSISLSLPPAISWRSGVFVGPGQTTLTL